MKTALPSVVDLQTLRFPFAVLLQLVSLILVTRSQTVFEVSGHVRDQNGVVVAGAIVVFRPRGGNGSLNVVTGADGSFNLGVAGAGQLTITAAGFASRRAEIGGNGDQILDISLLPAAIHESVTVTRTSGGAGDSPASVVGLDRREIEITPAQTLDDKLRQVPGFSLFRRAGSRTANPTVQGVSLRGVGASGASRAMVLSDDVPLNDPFGGWIYWGRVPVESLASIEVLRGTAGDLYGSAAVGGVVALRTLNESDARLSLESSYGTQTTPSVSAFGSRKWGLFAGSLAVEGLTTNGFVAVSHESRGPVDTPSDSKRLTLIPRLRLSTNDVDLFLKTTFYDEQRHNGTPLQDNDTRLREFVAGLDRDAETIGTFSLRGYYLGQVYDQSFSAVTADRETESLSRLQRVPSETVGSSLVWRKLFGTRFQAFSGGEIRVVHGRGDETAFANSRAASLISAGGREFTFAVFVGAQATIGERLTVSGGLRYDRWRNYSGFSATRSLTTNNATRQIFPDRMQEALNPRLSALIKINPHVSLSSSFSTGFRQPTLNELYRSFRVGDVLTTANAALLAERARTFEAAVAFSGFNDRFRPRVGFFSTLIRNSVSNVTLSITPTLITRRRQNVGRLLSRGIEIDGNFRLSNDVSISGGYLFADSRVTAFPADATLVGLRIPQIPRHQLTFSLSYSRSSIATISAQLRAAGDQFDDDRNRFPLRGFYTVDLYGSRGITHGFNVFAAVENLFDRRIEAGRTPVLTLASPRTARIGVRLDLGGK